MRRRGFLTVFGGLLSAKLLPGEHHVVSVDPLEIESGLASLEDRYTAVEDFYVRNHHATPRHAALPFLRLEGEVAKPVRLTPADLAHLKRLRLSAVLECAGNLVSQNGLVSNGSWEGWSLSEVLDLARPSGSAAFVHLFGQDGYARSIAIDRVHSDAMLATNLAGRLLQPNHGAPWRAFFPGWYGMDSVKWLGRIVFSSTPLATAENEYMEMRPATPVGVVRRPLPRIQVKSLITSPTEQSEVHHGSVEVRGLAWSGEGSIAKVELTTDGGSSWHEVDVSAGSPYEWALWRASVNLSRPGAIELVCRATDAHGNTQPERRDIERLDGYGQNWYHHVQVEVM